MLEFVQKHKLIKNILAYMTKILIYLSDVDKYIHLKIYICWFIY